MTSVSRLLLALLLPLMGAATASAQQNDPEGEAAMLARINELRAEAGVNALERDPRLDSAARTHSVDMAWHQMVEHVSPRTGTPADRVNATGVEASGLAENVSFNHTAAQAQEGLEASGPHRQNMVAAGMTHVGLSVVYADSGVYATQVFASLASAEEDAANDDADDAEEEEAVPTMPPPAPVPAPAPPPPPVADQPAQQHQQQQQQQSQPIAVSNGQRIVGYWVLSAGRWYYYPMPPNARPGQRLTPDLSVTGGPPAAVLRRHQQMQAQQHAQQAPTPRRVPVRPPPPVYRWRVRL